MRETKARFQEKRLFRIATPNCGNGTESHGRKGLDGEINLYFNIIESIISVEADSTIFHADNKRKTFNDILNSAKQT